MMTQRLSILFVVVLLLAPRVYAADYQLTDLGGKLHRVSDHRGKFVIINFWATWCAPCIHEMPELERFHQSNRDRAMVWGVTFERIGKDRVIDFVENLGVTYPILGFGQEPRTGYGQVTVLPTTFIIDREGLFMRRFEGPITAADLENAITED